MAESLKERTAKGLFWGTLNSSTTQVLNLAMGIVLARLLSPEDYGLVGVLTIFSAIAAMLQSSGLGTGLINLKRPTDNDYNAVFWFNVIVSILLYGLLFVCAPIIANFFHQPRLIVLSRVLFLTLPLSASSNASGVYLQKNMMNREIAIVGITSLVLSGATAVVMASQGYSYWSLVGQQLTFAVAILIGRSLYVKWKPSFNIDFTPVKLMFGFCIKLLITNIVNVVNFHVLTFIFGRFLPIQTVGYYSQANKWNNMAKTTIADAVGQVAQPVLVSVTDESDREWRVFRKMVRFTALLSFPALFGLALVAHEFIVIAIGEKWLESIPLLRIICIGGAFMPFYTLYQNLSISHGRSDIYMWCNIGQMLAQIVLVLLLYQYGIITVVCGCTLLTIIWLGVWQMAVGYRTIKLKLIELLKDIVPFMLISLTVMGVTYLATSRISNLYLLLITRIIIAAVLYVIALKITHAKVMEECIMFIKMKLNKS